MPIDASSSTSKGRKNVQDKKRKRLKTMLAVREEADEGQILLSPPTASRKTAAPTPTVAAAAGTLIYLNSYGDTEAPAEALASDEEVDYMPDGNIVISRPSKGSKSAEPEATQKSKGSKSAATKAPIVDILHLPSDEVYGSSEKSDSDFSVAAGLEFSDDKDVLDLHVDSDDEMRSSFPKDTMNNANQLARQKTAVDVLNGVILLLKLEADRFQRYKQVTWEQDNMLTDKGLKLMEECFINVQVQDYQITVIPIGDGHRATVTKCTINATKFTVVIPATGKYDSRFGTCNCGKPAKDGVPCEHMVAVVKSSHIDGLSQNQMMPYWWMNAHWQAQYAGNVECRADIAISTIKDKYTPDKTLCYCPAWTAGKKKGHPKANVRKTSVMDYVAESAKESTRGKQGCSVRYARGLITILKIVG